MLLQMLLVPQRVWVFVALRALCREKCVVTPWTVPAVLCAQCVPCVVCCPSCPPNKAQQQLPGRKASPDINRSGVGDQ